MPDHVYPVEAEVAHQRGRVVGELLHRHGRERGAAAAAVAALVEPDELRVPRERTERVAVARMVETEPAVHHERGRALALELVPDRRAVALGRRHGHDTRAG
jgi:hypothetical protein